VRIARLYGASIGASGLMVLLHWSILTDRSSTAAIAYFWTPWLVPFGALAGALFAWSVAAANAWLGRRFPAGTPEDAPRFGEPRR